MPSSDRVVWCLSECKHNHFNHSRVKKGRAWLSCRDCGTKWRTPHPLRSLCPEFYETRGFCSLGSSCPYLHVHRFKCTERAPTHIGYVGEDRDDLLRECAIVVLTACLPEQPLPRDVMPQIWALYEARRSAIITPPSIRAHYPVVDMLTAKAIAFQAMEDQQSTEVNRVPTPPVAAKMIVCAPMVLSPPLGPLTAADVTSATTGLTRSPAALPAQSHPSLLRVTARYVPTQRALRKGRASSTDNDTFSHGSSK